MNSPISEEEECEWWRNGLKLLGLYLETEDARDSGRNEGACFGVIGAHIY